LDVHIVPYMTFCVVPIMGCMSDQDDSVRRIATHVFAQLVRLMPLEVRNPRVLVIQDDCVSKHIHDILLVVM